MVGVALVLYLFGVAVGLLRVDGPPLTKFVVALSWPIGVLAGLLTVSALMLSAMVLFPIVGAVVAVAAALLWVALGR